MSAASTPLPVPPLSAPGLRDQVLAQHLELMFEQSRSGFVGNLVVSAVSVVALWGLADHRVLLVWVALIYVLTFARTLFILRYRRVRPAPAWVRRWAWGFAVSTVLAGSLWGSMGVLFFDPANPLTVLFVGWVLAGVITAGVPSLSCFLPAYVGYILPATLPYAYSSFAVGGGYTAFGVLTVYFLIANLLYARSANRSTGESIRLRFENLALLEQLQAAKDRAETANNAKTKFLAAASHDLRQPTHAMGLFLGAMERLLQRSDATRQDALVTTVGRMKRTLKSMGALLGSLLDASRLDAGTVQVQRGPLRLQDQLDNLQNEFAESAQTKGLGLRFVRTGVLVDSDPVLLGRILSNLLANAIKYTERGRIVVGCRRVGSLVEVQVHDTGIGIDALHHEDIFREYTQLGNAANNREQGLGLGLSIVRRMSQMLGHEIGLRSQPQRGSVFTVRLPRARAAAIQERLLPRVAPPLAATGTVIVVDDDTAAREAIVQILELHEYRVIAGSGVEEVRARLASERIDALMIVADYRLGGGVTGLDAIAAVQPLLTRPTQAAIVTGDTSPERIREVQTSGYPLLHKPLDPDKLLDVLRAASRAQAPAT